MLVGAAILLTLGFGPAMVGRATAAWRISPELAEMTRRAPSVDVTVVLGFQPRPFHTRELQNIGILGGVDSGNVILRAVPSDRMTSLAALYWIRSIEPLTR